MTDQPEETTYGDFQDAANHHEDPAAPSPRIGVEEAVERVTDGTAVIIDSAKAALALYVTADGEVQIQSVYNNGQIARVLRQIADKAEQRYKEGRTHG